VINIFYILKKKTYFSSAKLRMSFLEDILLKKKIVLLALSLKSTLQGYNYNLSNKQGRNCPVQTSGPPKWLYICFCTLFFVWTLLLRCPFFCDCLTPVTLPFIIIIILLNFMFSFLSLNHTKINFFCVNIFI
jgi:hypothetical protein